jgi:hypothetical protein
MKNYITCNELRCPDYPFCCYENTNGRRSKCEQREIEFNNKWPIVLYSFLGWENCKEEVMK